MPSFTSPNLYIDFSRLPPPSVIETIDFEVILSRYQTHVVGLNLKLAGAVKLQQSPTNVILQAESYGEMLVRQRINEAARAVMLPFAKGSDLENLGAFHNLQRAVITPATDRDPAVMETDERLLSRIRLAAESYATAGPAGAYIFHAMDAVPALRDVSAIKVAAGSVLITLMLDGAVAVPEDDTINAVYDYLHVPTRKPMTAEISVRPVQVIDVDFAADVTLYPGPDAGMVVGDIKKAVGKARDRCAMLGRDLTRSALFAALSQEGVQNAIITSPAADVVVDATQCVRMRSANITINTARTE